MRWTVFKVISFLVIFLFLQSTMLPWLISLDAMPLWVDILLITFVLLIWLAVIDRLAFQLLRALRKNDEAT